jgi:hypothetical protein
MVDDFGVFRWVRRKAGLETELDTGRSARVWLETQVLLENPEELSRKAALGQKALPGGQSVFEWRALIMTSAFHRVH